MLAVFDKSVAEGPKPLIRPESGANSSLKNGFIAKHFESTHSGAVCVNLGPAGIMSYSMEKQDPAHPRLFTVMNDIFCIFQGHIGNVAKLKHQYGLGKIANEATIVVEAYRTLRDRGPYPIDQVVRDFQGKYAFILYDSTSKAAFVAVDSDCSVPILWGIDADGNLVFTDEKEVAYKSCGKSHAPFPKGCFFTSSGGLRSFEHPLHNLRPIQRVNSAGVECGALFKVDPDSRKESPGMPRVGSAADWSTKY